MNQSTTIFGFLAIAFLIFITQRGELPTYWGLLVKSPQGSSAGPTASGSGAISSSSLAANASTLATIAAGL